MTVPRLMAVHLTVVETFYHDLKRQLHGGTRGKVNELWGQYKFVPNFSAIHAVVVEIFQSGPKWGTD